MRMKALESCRSRAFVTPVCGSSASRAGSGSSSAANSSPISASSSWCLSTVESSLFEVRTFGQGVSSDAFWRARTPLPMTRHCTAGRLLTHSPIGRSGCSPRSAARSTVSRLKPLRGVVASAARSARRSQSTGAPVPRVRAMPRAAGPVHATLVTSASRPAAFKPSRCHRLSGRTARDGGSTIRRPATTPEADWRGRRTRRGWNQHDRGTTLIWPMVTAL